MICFKLGLKRGPAGQGLLLEIVYFVQSLDFNLKEEKKCIYIPYSSSF